MKKGLISIDKASVWYVLRLKPNGLDLAKQNLTKQGYDPLMPVQEVTLRTRRGLRRTRRALFPGYLFFTASHGVVNWTSVRSTRGVAGLVTVAGKPAQLPALYAEELRQAVDAEGVLPSMLSLSEGDRVRLIDGPMTGWLAEVLDASESDRLRLLVDVMGRSVRTNVNRGSVEPLG